MIINRARLALSLTSVGALAAAAVLSTADPTPEPQPIGPTEVHLCDSAAETGLRVDIHPAAVRTFRGRERLELAVSVDNLEDEDADAAFGLVVVRPDGTEVEAPQVFERRHAPAHHSVGERVELTDLPDGYYRVEARALAQLGKRTQKGDAQLYLRSQKGHVEPVEFDEWWERSGVAEHGGEITRNFELQKAVTR